MEGFLGTLIHKVTEGGPFGLVAFLLLAVVACGYVLNYLIKIVISTAEKQILNRDTIIKDKDDLLDKGNDNLIGVISRYHETNTSLKESMIRIEAGIVRLETLVNTLQRSRGGQVK